MKEAKPTSRIAHSVSSVLRLKAQGVRGEKQKNPFFLRIGFVFTPHLIGSPAGDDALIPERASLPLYLKTSAGGPPAIG
jgi:hypothetical protein